MRLGTMTALVVLLVSIPSSCERNGMVKQEESPHRHRHNRGSNLRTTPRARRRQQQRQLEEVLTPPERELALTRQLETAAARREVQHRYADPTAAFTVCCPADEERTSPLAGTRLDGTLGVLDTSGGTKQVFFERSCRRQADDEWARVARHLRKRSAFRCQQEYSYSMAVFSENGGRVLDYMRIRSGCRCELAPASRRHRKRRRQRRKKVEMRRRERRRRLPRRKYRTRSGDGDAS